MNFAKLLFLGVNLVFIFSCAHVHVPYNPEIHAHHPKQSAHEFEQENGASSPAFQPVTPPNLFGWDASNCAHIMPDGHCAHPIHGVNAIDPGKHATCAHVLADGTCAHEM